MPYAQLDEKFDDDDDVLSLSDSAAILFVCSISFSSRHKTDGFISEVRAKKLKGFSAKTCAELLNVNFWIPADGGYQIRTYLKHNSSREYIERTREQTRERMRKCRLGDGVTNSVTSPVTAGEGARPKTKQNNTIQNKTKPNPADVEAAFVKRDRRNPADDAREFWEHHDNNGWCDAKGRPIENWRAYIGFWIDAHPEEPKPRRLTAEELELIHR